MSPERSSAFRPLALARDVQAPSGGHLEAEAAQLAPGGWRAAGLRPRRRNSGVRHRAMSGAKAAAFRFVLFLGGGDAEGMVGGGGVGDPTWLRSFVIFCVFGHFLKVRGMVVSISM